MIRCPHVGLGPCLCRARARLERLARTGARPTRRRPATRSTTAPRFAPPRGEPLRFPEYVVLHAALPRRDGTCLACRRPVDDTGCAVLKITTLKSNGLGLAALSLSACAGQPGPHALALGEPLP